jgi:hypothetical protein
VNLVTPEQLAQRFQIGVEKLHDLRVRKGWPFVQLGRFEVRFTEAQIEQIVVMHTQTPPRPSPVVGVPGQTARSAARNHRGPG